MTSILDRIRDRVRADFTDADPAHDIHHLDRVAALAGDIAARLGGDPLTAQVAAYVHDYHRVEEAKQGRRPIRPEEARAAVLDVLARCGVPEEMHGTVLHAVELTGRYRFGGDDLDNQSVIAAAVHDADNLDAMGAIGIGRAFAFGGLLGEPLWSPGTQLKERYAEGETSSVLAHLYEKLVRLEKDMLTEPARRLAAERAQLLHRFAAEFRTEWGDEDASCGTVCPDGTRVHWEPRTRFLSVTTPENERHDGQDEARHDGPNDGMTRITFRGRVGLSLDERGRPVGVDLLEVPAALAHCVPHATRRRPWTADETAGSPWSLDPEANVVWISLTETSVHRRLTAIGDIEAQLRDDVPAALRLHLTEQPVDWDHDEVHS
ncbi:HD domain-containing protein [Streptomyces decoyicus]|uniref:HD domain-containing protein n=1 Tax=Streptomyces decoyicus TaxID=249567 RepID=UPI0033D4FCC0